MSPGRKASPSRGAVPFGSSFATADLTLKSPERRDQPAGVFGNVGVRPSIAVGNPIDKDENKRHDDENSKERIHATAGDRWLRSKPIEANNGFSDFDLDQTMRRWPARP